MKAVYKIVTGTGADLNIELGVKIDHVKVINLTTFDVNEAWYDDGTLKKSVQMDASSGIVTEDADGISLLSGTLGPADTDAGGAMTYTAEGIQLDASALSNVDTNELYVIAETYELEAGGAAASTSVL